MYFFNLFGTEESSYLSFWGRLRLTFSIAAAVRCQLSCLHCQRLTHGTIWSIFVILHMPLERLHICHSSHVAGKANCHKWFMEPVIAVVWGFLCAVSKHFNIGILADFGENALISVCRIYIQGFQALQLLNLLW